LSIEDELEAEVEGTVRSSTLNTRAVSSRVFDILKDECVLKQKK